MTEQIAEIVRTELAGYRVQHTWQGKKLGFIAQEIGREINTLGSKSNHAEMQIIVVRMKDVLEQIKEQYLKGIVFSTFSYLP